MLAGKARCVGLPEFYSYISKAIQELSGLCGIHASGCQSIYRFRID